LLCLTRRYRARFCAYSTPSILVISLT